jgi:hypothetical protein
MAQRSLSAVTKVYYRSMSYFATVSRINGPACSAKVSCTNIPSCTMWKRQFIKYDAISHPIKHDTLPIVFLISRQAIPYRIHGDTCYPGVSTPKIRSLIDSSTTCHDSINHLHHSNHCSNHSIDPHTVIAHLNKWKTTTILQRHKPNSTSQRMEDLYDTHNCITKHN